MNRAMNPFLGPLDDAAHVQRRRHGAHVLVERAGAAAGQGCRIVDVRDLFGKSRQRLLALVTLLEDELVDEFLDPLVNRLERGRQQYGQADEKDVLAAASLSENVGRSPLGAGEDGNER